MECSQIRTITKHGTDDYSLWELTLPRDKIHEIRQGTPTVSGDMRRVFEEIRSAGRQPEGMCNFILPHGTALRLYAVDMGADFAERNRYNGSSVRGTRQDIMAELQENLKAQGYNLRYNACFLNVDVLETLQKIVEHNTKYYQTDFQYDIEQLKEAAGDRNANKQFFWMSRDSGTWCFPQRDVYIRDTNPYNTWLYYGGCPRDHVKTFFINLKGIDGEVRGDIVELDYQKHLDYLCTHSFDPAKVEMVFKNPNDIRIFDYQEYNQNWQSISQRYGTLSRKSFLVDNPYALDEAMRGAQWAFWEAAEEMGIDDYVKRLDRDRLHDHGYTADDVVLTGPLDAEKAVAHGLACYALCGDGTKEAIIGKEEFQKHHYAGALFGMGAEEKQLLQYFKQNSTPLFSNEEMRTICALALQAGMENNPAHARLLDSIIHKAECALPQEERGELPLPEIAYEREE